MSRRLFQVSLRVLFVVLTLLTIVLAAWLSRARQQKASVASLRLKYGATVLYENEDATKPSRIPKWLVNSVGIDAFYCVILVSVDSSEFSDSDMWQLSRFSKLNCLRLERCQVSGRGLLAIKNQEDLQELYLMDMSIRDEAVQELIAMSQLRWLGLTNSEITPQDVQTLKDHLPDCHVGPP